MSVSFPEELVNRRRATDMWRRLVWVAIFLSLALISCAIWVSLQMRSVLLISAEPQPRVS